MNGLVPPNDPRSEFRVCVSGGLQFPRLSLSICARSCVEQGRSPGGQTWVPRTRHLEVGQGVNGETQPGLGPPPGPAL